MRMVDDSPRFEGAMLAAPVALSLPFPLCPKLNSISFSISADESCTANDESELGPLLYISPVLPVSKRINLISSVSLSVSDDENLALP